jgi:WD40 repeat protein
MTLNGHVERVNSIAFSPDGLSIVSGSDDRTAKVWSALTSEDKMTLKGHVGWCKQ